MTTRIGINGFGRIGRSFVRGVTGNPELEVVALNDVTATSTLAHLLRYDSTYGRFGHEVSYDNAALIVDGDRIAVTAEADPAKLDWAAHGVDIVIESTGRFRTREDAAYHLKAGARKVLISAPAKGPIDATIVMGVNDETYEPEHHDVISNASCTTNCVAPMVKVLEESFGLVKGFMTTIHGYTNDQVILDAPHKDLHRARAGAVNIIPTSTGAARTTGLVVKSAEGKLDGVAVRVPVEDGSLTDLAAILAVPATTDELNAAFQVAAEGPLAGILRYCTDPIVSRDVIGDSSSCVYDATLTQANGELVKVFGWYDNEYGYTCRLVDLCGLVAKYL